MTIEEIASFCEIKDCRVKLGDPEVGSITIDGTGVERKFNNYRRFLALNELSKLPNPRKVLEGAARFAILEGGTAREMTRDEFARELERFQELLGA